MFIGRPLPNANLVSYLRGSAVKTSRLAKSQISWVKLYQDGKLHHLNLSAKLNVKADELVDQYVKDYPMGGIHISEESTDHFPSSHASLCIQGIRIIHSHAADMMRKSI